jgi:oligopeptidase B
LRSDTVLKHKLGTDTAEDEVVYFEKMILLMLQLVKKNQKIYFNQFCTLTEFMTLLADNPDGEFKVFQKRKEV